MYHLGEREKLEAGLRREVQVQASSDRGIRFYLPLSVVGDSSQARPIRPGCPSLSLASPGSSGHFSCSGEGVGVRGGHWLRLAARPRALRCWL